MATAAADSSGVAFRLRAVRAGVALSLFCCLYVGAFTVVSWAEPNRPAILAVVVVAILGSLLIARIPVEGLMWHPRRREAFFLAWSAGLIAIVTAVTVLDGGLSSPLAALYFLPLVFGALSYPTGSMIALAILDVAAYAGVGVVVGGVSATDVALVGMSLVCASWMCAWQARSHEHARRELAGVSLVDPLTGALNRRGFDERFDAELNRAARAGEAVGLILLDLDDFKRTNDSLGHAAGDAQLRWAVRTMTTTLRPSDAVGRIGGDEFAILVPGGAARETGLLADRLQAALAEGAPSSIGVAVYPADGQDRDAVQQLADLDLYAVKQARAAQRVAAGPRELSWAATLADAVDRRMGIRHEHSVTVSRYAVLIGERLGFDEGRLDALRLAAVLHDIGKIAVPESVLRKAGPLTTSERVLVTRHSAVGADMVTRIEGLQELAPWVRHSHEHVDGSGYPDGLRGDEIPIESRILLVADAFDAMTSDRSYSAAMEVDVALAELRRCAGRQFDAACVDLLAVALAPEPGPGAAPAPAIA
jgi:diguanylate cyclase (GGDEF)-like protein/putative nucleotidyltransferase with HDIG domain